MLSDLGCYQRNIRRKIVYNPQRDFCKTIVKSIHRVLGLILLWEDGCSLNPLDLLPLVAVVLVAVVPHEASGRHSWLKGPQDPRVLEPVEWREGGVQPGLPASPCATLPARWVVSRAPAEVKVGRALPAWMLVIHSGAGSNVSLNECITEWMYHQCGNVSHGQQQQGCSAMQCSASQSSAAS